MWRSTGDITDSWASIKDLAFRQVELQPYNGMNCYNDMDMLVVGMGGKGNVGLTGCTTEEYRTHYSLWAILNSPLMIGCDVRNMSAETKEILMNPEVIAINQDVSGRQPYRVVYDAEQMVWVKLLDNGEFAIGLFNMKDSSSQMHLMWADIGIDKHCGKAFALRDVWKHEDIGTFDDMYWSPILGAHECMLLRGKLVDAR